MERIHKYMYVMHAIFKFEFCVILDFLLWAILFNKFDS